MLGNWGIPDEFSNEIEKLTEVKDLLEIELYNL